MFDYCDKADDYYCLKDLMAGVNRLAIDDNVTKEGDKFNYLHATSFNIVGPSSSSSSNPSISETPSISLNPSKIPCV